MHSIANVLDELNKIEIQISNRLHRVLSGFGSSTDWSVYVDSLMNLTPTEEYNVLPENVIVAFRELAAETSVEVLEDGVKLLLVKTMIHWHTKTESNQNERTSSLKEIRVRETKRLIEDLQCPKGADRVWDLSNDVFLKDLQSYTGRIVPCGAQVVDLFSGVPRRTLVSDGFLRLAPNLSFFLGAGGLRNYYAIHTHTPTLSDFNEAGWERCYECIADLLTENPSIRGMLGGSWFYDPALESISPRLAYLRKTPLKHGARLFNVGASESGTNGAIATSPTRRNLYEEGRYSPKQYLLVWPRNQLLEWSRNRH